MFVHFVLVGFSVVVIYIWWQRKINVFVNSEHGHYLGHSILSLLVRILRKLSSVDEMLINYNEVKKAGKKFGISIEINRPNIFICDADLARSVLIKHFDSFHDRNMFIESKLKEDKYFTKILLVFTGQKWRESRNALSPVFTTRNLRQVFNIASSSSELLVKFLEDHRSSADFSIDMRIGIEKIAMDIIAKAAFGFDPHTYLQKAPTLFEKQGKNLESLGGNTFCLLIIALFPSLANLLGLSFIQPKVQEFFGQAVETEIRRRKATNERREDFLQFFIDSTIKNTSAKAFSLDEIVAQCILFIAAGFLPLQGAILTIIYQLAIHSQIQEKLAGEVNKIRSNGDSGFLYEDVKHLEYLDNVITEAMRLFPAGVVTDRVCTTSFQMPGTNFIVRKGWLVSVPIAAIQKDPEYFENPDIFNPERFSGQNKFNTQRGGYFAFGDGPRHCLGKRFALLEMKVVLCHLLHSFRFETCNKTVIPMKYSDGNSFRPRIPVGEVWIKLIPRK